MRLLTVLLPIAASLAFAQDRPGVCYPITGATVAHFLQANGIAVNSSQVHLPMELTATVPEPQFEIVATRRVTDTKTRLELRCHNIGACLPFDALVDVAGVKATTAEMHPVQRSDKSADNPWPSRGPKKNAPWAEVKSKAVAHLRVGMQAVLVIDDGQMQIHFPVIAIDDGSLGALVRVSSLDRKKIFHALVIGDGIVKGVID